MGWHVMFMEIARKYKVYVEETTMTRPLDRSMSRYHDNIKMYINIRILESVGLDVSV
jgi:hypothetical protein